MIQERCWFSQINFFVEYFPHWINVLFLSSQFLCHPHTQIRTILFHDEQRDIPNLEFCPIHVSKGFSQIAFPIIVLPKDDHTDLAQEERLGLPYWTMILALLCRGRRILMFGHSDFGTFNNFGASSISTWGSADAASVAYPADPGSLDMISTTVFRCRNFQSLRHKNKFVNQIVVLK